MRRDTYPQGEATPSSKVKSPPFFHCVLLGIDMLLLPLRSEEAFEWEEFQFCPRRKGEEEEVTCIEG